MLIYLVIVPILTALFLYMLPFEKVGKIIAIAVRTLYTAYAFHIFLLCKNGDIITKIGDYDGILGIILKADTFSSVFILLTSFLFLIAAVYNYREKPDPLFRFLMFIWQGLLTGVFLSQDMFNIFVLIEVATVVVSILIIFNRDNRFMQDGMVYLMANTVAIQFYLLGIGYIYKLTGSLDMSVAAESIQHLDKSDLVLPYALIMTSVSLKCALMPLFSWLPKAHGSPGAPSAVSALLSGLHIKSSIYLFIRFQDIFQKIDLSGFFLIAGIITGIAGFLFALSQSDIKLTLAYSTISQIGMVMIGLNAGNVYSYTGGVYHIINHALFKTALFLSAGMMAEAYKTRDIYEIRGVLKRMPLAGITTLLSVLGIVGAPLFNGSISKYFIMSGTDWLTSGAISFINLGTIITFVKYTSMLFGTPKHEPAPQNSGIAKRASVLIPSVLCLTGGIFGQQAIMFLFGVDISVSSSGYIQKVLFFILSVAVGILVYRYFIRKSALFKRIREIELGFRGICVSIGLFFAVILIAASTVS